MIRLKKRAWANAEGTQKHDGGITTFPKKCYDCNNGLKRQSVHKVTLRSKARFYCDRCYHILIEKMRGEKNG